MLSVGDELPLFAGLEDDERSAGVARPPHGRAGGGRLQRGRAVAEGAPDELLRPALSREGILTGTQLREADDKAMVRVAGLVLMRQAPPTAKGAVFITLEDEFGSINLIVLEARVGEVPPHRPQRRRPPGRRPGPTHRQRHPRHRTADGRSQPVLV